jgi:hypothetical protein
MAKLFAVICPKCGAPPGRPCSTGAPHAERKKKARGMKAKDREFSPEYLAYLNSAKWKRMRIRILERDRWLCGCGARAEQVHHLSYKRFGNEDDEDLVSVCGPCHRKVHA